MRKKALPFVMILALSLSMAACGNAPAAETPAPAAESQVTETVETLEENDEQAAPSQADDLRTEASESSEPATETGRQDGERFEAIIMIEGMEETVQYTHIVNVTLGFEMDYDYERFTRIIEADRELFVSVWDDDTDPENYLEVTYSDKDAESVAASVRETLSHTYDLYEESRKLDHAGDCLYIEASVLKGTNTMADQLQMVYIIPANDGCFVATIHCAIEASEGFGRRFSYMLNTLAVVDR